MLSTLPKGDHYNNYSASFIFSIIAHLFLLGLFFFSMTQSNSNVDDVQKIEIGKEDVLVHAYAYQYDVKNSPVNRADTNNHNDNNSNHYHPKKTNPSTNTDSFQNRVTHQKRATLKKRSTSFNEASIPQGRITSEITEGKYNSVLQQLHNAIAKAQRYPENAYQLNQHGTTKIEFILHPNGTMSQIALIKESGYSLLDEAALRSVKAIQPFYMSGNHLIKSERFSVSIEF